MENESIKRLKNSLDYRPCFEDLDGHFQGKDCTIPEHLCGTLGSCMNCDIYLMKNEYGKRQKAPVPLEIQFALLKTKNKQKIL